MRVILGPRARIPKETGIAGGAPWLVSAESGSRRPVRLCLAFPFLIAAPFLLAAQLPQTNSPAPVSQGRNLPPRVAQAQRFLAQRGAFSRGAAVRAGARSNALPVRVPNRAQSQGATATWEPLGPAAVITPGYGLVTGRVSALALDPSDSTGNRLFVGTTGGGVWVSQNAATSGPANIKFVPLTDNLPAMTNAADASISIGALSVQPGGTGVILAGTGDPNDAMDSYYGAGILRSTDGGNSWSLIQFAKGTTYSFVGEGFAGFAWSSVNPQLVVAAVSQAWEGVLVGAERSGRSYEGLYYSIDSGATWALAQITDLNGQDVQGPNDGFTNPDGNAATSVVWNPVRNVFIAAVRYHGYYQSSDGTHWTRLASQPGTGLTTAMCPTRPQSTGSPACPIYRGTLAVNPVTGDTFAWTVDLDDQDQGIWQDACGIGAGVCANQAISFGKQWTTVAMQANTWLGSAAIQNGSYNLALAAVPSGQDTILLAGANDLWKCSLAMGCVWRNTTNSTLCMSARVGEYQHAVEWNQANPLELFVGNDSGLWRSTDAVGESGPVCSASDATHFQNLNGALGSLAEVESMSAVGSTPYTMMLGLGANGAAGVKGTTGPSSNWPQILSGEGGPVAIDPAHPDNWYVNNGAGVSIHLCSQSALCTPGDFGSTPVVSNADVNGDGLTMFWPAPFLVDPLDTSQLLIGTCRIWRGPASGAGWTAANAVSPMFDGNRTSSYCNGNALVRILAAMPIAGGGEIVYAGTYGSADGGATLPGHVFSATLGASGAWSAWQDLTLNPVANDQLAMNAFGMDVSSIFIDPHDSSGNTVYVTIEGIPNSLQAIIMVYRTTDGGAHWYKIQSNLPLSAANAVVVDPQDANTVYIATDEGVYITRNVASCASAVCWSPFGAGLPGAPVVALSAAPPATSPNVLAAGTYGRGVWQIPLATAGVQTTTATIAPAALDFGSQAFGVPSSPRTVTLTNTGSVALQPGTITITGDFSETDNCANATLNTGQSCAIQVTFTPSQAGPRTAQLTVSANIPGGTLSVALSGTGEAPGAVTLTPLKIDFGQVKVGSTSAPLPVTAENSGQTAVAIAGITISGPFVLATNSCGTSSFPANSDCQLQVEFAPTAAGPATGTLTIVDDAGTQVVQLTGNGAAPPTDTLSTTSLTFAATNVGQTSAPQNLTLTNSGDLPLTSIAATVSGPFQLTNNCTAQLAAHSSCSLAVSFVPTQSGAQSGSLTITDAVNKGQTVSLSGTGLSGTGFDFQVTVSGPSSQTVSGGQTASYTLSLANTSGSSATFSLQCGSLPAYAACTFSPSSPTVSGSATGSVSLQITTSQASSAVRVIRVGGWQALPPLLAVLWLPVFRRVRRRALLPLAGLAITLAAGLSACSSSGGGGGGSPPPPVTHTTPAGTYTIPVTVSSAGVQHSVNLTLVVD